MMDLIEAINKRKSIRRFSDDAALKEITGLDPLYIMPIGRIK
jgi:nitroreductase